MKFVTLVDGSKANFEKMISSINTEKATVIDTEGCSEIGEYNYLLEKINEFTESDKEIMITKFSGRTSMFKELGDESPIMITCLSYNKSSKFYAENPVNMFLDLIKIFRKGD